MNYLFFMTVFMLGGLCGALVTLGIFYLDQRADDKCKKKNCQQLSDGYCARCHSGYYGGF